MRLDLVGAAWEAEGGEELSRVIDGTFSSSGDDTGAEGHAGPAPSRAVAVVRASGATSAAPCVLSLKFGLRTRLLTVSLSCSARTCEYYNWRGTYVGTSRGAGEGDAFAHEFEVPSDADLGPAAGPGAGAGASAQESCLHIRPALPADAARFVVSRLAARTAAEDGPPRRRAAAAAGGAGGGAVDLASVRTLLAQMNGGQGAQLSPGAQSLMRMVEAAQASGASAGAAALSSGAAAAMVTRPRPLFSLGLRLRPPQMAGMFASLRNVASAPVPAPPPQPPAAARPAPVPPAPTPALEPAHAPAPDSPAPAPASASASVPPSIPSGAGPAPVPASTPEPPRTSIAYPPPESAVPPLAAFFLQKVADAEARTAERLRLLERGVHARLDVLEAALTRLALYPPGAPALPSAPAPPPDPSEYC
eukprot:tig00021373_g21079.t1